MKKALAVFLVLLLASCGGGGSGDNVPVLSGADLSISNVDDLDPIVAGGTLVYTVTVSNAGPNDATGVVVRETLPAGVTLLSTSGCTEDPNGTTTCSLGDIASGGNARFIVTVTIDAGTSGTITHSASVASASGDPDASNNMVAQGTAVVLPNTVIGSQLFDIQRDPARLFESAMGNLVADAMRLKYPGVEAAYFNSGSMLADINCSPPSAGEQACEITWREIFAVLPFGNRTVIMTLTGVQLEQAFLNGFSPVCDPAIHTGRFPQISGLRAAFTCNGMTPVVTGIWKTPIGIGGPQTRIGPTDAVRFVTNDFMYGGGDGYTMFAQGANVQQAGDGVLKATIEYVMAKSPVGPLVEGRIVGP